MDPRPNYEIFSLGQESSLQKAHSEIMKYSASYMD